MRNPVAYKRHDEVKAMPVTPFHLGPGLFFGIIFIKYLDPVAFLLGNVILDVEPFFIVLYSIKNPYRFHYTHGFFHTIVGAFLLSLLAAFILKRFQQKIRKASKILDLSCLRLDLKKILKGNSGFRRIFLSVFAGTLLHLVFDALTHYDVFPFWPSHFNPLLRLVSYPQNMINCTIFGVSGTVLLFFYLKRKERKRKNI